MNPSASFNCSRNLNDEINSMVSNLTGALTPNADEGEDAGFRIITISGTNTGATMKADRLQHGVMQANEIIYDGGEDENCLDAYANNNYQAVNNSVLVGGSYSADDPGVHVEMVNEKGGDDVDGEEEEEEKTETERKIKV